MMSLLRSIRRTLETSSQERQQHEPALAIAVLMIELMRMDGHEHDCELTRLRSLLQQRLGLDDMQVHKLIERARHEANMALDIQQFTRAIVAELNTEERIGMLADLWRLAWADQHLDPQEEQLLRRIGELLGLSHRQFIQAKLTADS
ncbi:MAG: TerB family tellurite resistance protein [Zetaproteobacteria bacterium]|nr:MAG: TerB family tellurite resistance protein [Zetaproteobacteria bacterium]